MEKEILVLDYYPTTLFPSEYEKTLKNGGYVKMPFLHAKGDSQPNFVHNGRKYKTETLYILKSTIPKSGANGELVIKHVPITNGDVPIYLVIPLKTQPAVYEETVVDKMIHNVYRSSFSFDLGEIIGYNKICRVNEANTVYVLSPMVVKTIFDKDHGFTQIPDISGKWNYDENKTKFREIRVMFSALDPLNENEPIVEGLTTSSTNNEEEDVYYDCKPIIENGSEIKPSIEVMPITSQLARNMGTMNVLTATVHFFIFLFMTVIATFAMPFLYKLFFVDYIKVLNIANGVKSIASLKMLDYIGSFILFMFSIGISIGGISVGDKIQTSIGAMMTIFLMIGITIITYYKQLYPNMYSFGSGEADIFQDSDLINKIFQSLKHNYNWAYSLGITVSFFIIGLLIYLFGKGRFDKKSKKKDASKRNFILAYSSIFGVLLSIYITTRIKSRGTANAADAVAAAAAAVAGAGATPGATPGARAV